MATLSFSQIEDLWKANGGNPAAAPVMAAIALAESGGRTDAANTKPPDASYGLWQVNYYGPLTAGRTARYGAPGALVADPNAQARAAVDISGNGTNLRPWSTYTSGAYKQFLSGQLPGIPALPSAAGTPALETATQGETYDEGVITMPSVIPNVPRALLRRVAGGAVLVAGGVVGLAGVFVLVGAGGKLPGPLQVAGAPLRAVGQVRQAGVERRAAKAERSVAATTPDEVAARRRARAESRRIREGQASAADIPATGESF